MAKVLGKSGRYASEEATRRFGRMISIALIGLMGFSIIVGYAIAKNDLVRGILGLVAAVIVHFPQYSGHTEELG